MMQSTTYWHRNLAILWLGAFMSEGAISLIVPILPLFLKTLGRYSPSQLSLLSGSIFAVTFLIKAAASPLWGKLSDRIGHKPMMLRAAGGLSFCCLLIAIAPNVWVILLARAIQGIFSGYINNAESMIASVAPKQRKGWALGTLATGDTAGLLCGPIIGGVLATFVGFRGTFLIAAVLMLTVFGLTWAMVKETFTPVSATAQMGIRDTLAAQPHVKLLLLIFVLTLIVQATNNAISPILSLYLSELLPSVPHLPLISGIVAALPGIATVISAGYLGHLGDLHGQRKLLLMGLTLGTVVYLPQIFVTNIWGLSGLRFITGFSIAALLPALQALLTQNTNPDALGRVFSYNQTFQALGNVCGAMISAGVASAFGYVQVFTAVCLLEAIGLVLAWQLKG
ncbi:MFS transporter [Lacticaseibacillus jixiensis]|uniref:MFS transporter n=1 Tax=Lacticaseibacillus jixiensis TaxID=3231926 RepID=UPI0036F2FC62